MARKAQARSRHGNGRDTLRRLARRPYHVVKLGPMDTDEGLASMYMPITDDELLEPVIGEDDAAGLAAVVAVAGSGPRTCDVELLPAGEPLGFTAGEPPDWSVQAIAAIAARMHNAFTVAADVEPVAWDDLLDALAGFAWNVPWELWLDAERFTIEVSVDSDPPRFFDALVVGSDAVELGLVLYPGLGGADRADAAMAADDVEQMKRVPTISVTLDDEPAWVVAATEAAYGLAAAPRVFAQDDDGRRMVTALDLHVHAAALCAVAALSPWVREVTLLRAVPDGPAVRVTARVAAEP